MGQAEVDNEIIDVWEVWPHHNSDYDYFVTDDHSEAEAAVALVAEKWLDAGTDHEEELVTMFDTVHLAMRQAVESFGGRNTSRNTFNSAGFSSALRRISGTNGTIDGKVVEAILAGRDDVVQLSGGSHYRLIEVTDAIAT